MTVSKHSLENLRSNDHISRSPILYRVPYDVSAHLLADWSKAQNNDTCEGNEYEKQCRGDGNVIAVLGV